MVKVEHTRAFEIPPLLWHDTLHAFRDGVSAMSGHWWVSAGTLLGLYRDNNFIVSDSDIDVCVIGNLDRDLGDNFELVRLVDSDDGESQYQSAYEHLPTDIIFDINHYHEDGDQYITKRENEDDSDEEYIATPKSLVHPLKEMTFKDVTFPVPNDIPKYLEMWYGDWKTPSFRGKREWLK